MNAEKFSDGMGALDVRYVEEALHYKRRAGGAGWIKWGVLAACLCLAVWAGVRLILPGAAPGGDGDLPLLRARFTDIKPDSGMGFAAVMMRDISESGTANPWTEELALETLPVYENLAWVDSSGLAVYLSESQMLAAAREMADRLGARVTHTWFYRVGPDQVSPDTGLRGGEASGLFAETGEHTISVSGAGGIYVTFNGQEAEFDAPASAETAEAAEAYIRPTLEKYAGLLGLGEPVVDTGCWYSFDGERERWYRVYEDDVDPVQKILHYNFDWISVVPSAEEGALWSVRYHNGLACGEKIGDYPIITSREARELLLQGAYITTVPREYLGDSGIREEQIAKGELIYRTEAFNQVFMPYYCFYIRLDHREEGVEMADGLSRYGLFYVPAVSGAYLEDFPVWDGVCG